MPETSTTHLLINGSPRETQSTFAIVDPARPSVVVGHAAEAQPSDVADAIAAARVAATAWASMSAADRATAMAQAITGTEVDRDHIAQILTLENGKIRHESWVDALVFDIRWKLALSYAEHVETESVLDPVEQMPVRTRVTYQPLGVVTIIVPFNWPLAILAASLPLALLAGNTVIVKPPRTAPLATTIFLSTIAKKLPPGVLNVITGDDETVKPLLTDVNKVCFTGGVAAGRSIAATAASALVRTTLELGGNDPALILEDAVLDDENLDRIFHAVMDSTGQICMNIKRIYVHGSRFDELVAGLSQRFNTIVLGHGLNADTTHGPLHSAKQREYVQDLISDAKSSSATVLQFGSLPNDPELSNGYFVLPTLVLNPAQNSRIVQEEQFGPIVPIMSFENEEEAITLANDSWAGLGASVWSADTKRAHALADQIKAGYVWVNDHGAPRLDLRAPFGGMKSSGYGREQGLEGLRDFQDTRAVAEDA